MKLAEEIVVERFVPTVRALLVAGLERRGLAQTDIALRLGVSQAAVSKYAAGKVGPDPVLARDARVRVAVERLADGLAAGSMSSFEALAALAALVRELENRGPLCALHEEAVPALRGLGCDLCVRPAESVVLEEQRALADVRAAVAALEHAPGAGGFIPHVGSNVALALPRARGEDDVAAVPGGIFELKGRAKAAAPPEMGVSRHMARIVLALVGVEPGRRAALNLAMDDRLVASARALGLAAREVPAGIERDPGLLASALAGGGVPDFLYHRGAFGVEPQSYVTGASARAVAERACDLFRSALGAGEGGGR